MTTLNVGVHMYYEEIFKFLHNKIPYITKKFLFVLPYVQFIIISYIITYIY